MNWFWTAALGFVKLRVPSIETVEALEILGSLRLIRTGSAADWQIGSQSNIFPYRRCADSDGQEGSVECCNEVLTLISLVYVRNGSALRMYLKASGSPWLRWGARVFDNIAILLILRLVISSWPQHIPDEADRFWAMPVLLLWFPVETFFLSLFGATPGKWLFGISVLHHDGSRLTFRTALYRSVSVSSVAWARASSPLLLKPGRSGESRNTVRLCGTVNTRASSYGTGAISGRASERSFSWWHSISRRDFGWPHYERRVNLR